MRNRLGVGICLVLAMACGGDKESDTAAEAVKESLVKAEAVAGEKVHTSLSDAKSKTAEMQIRQLQSQAYTQWKMQTRGSCPASLSELLELTSMSDTKDPWGNDFVMKCGESAPAGGFAVVSKGPDGKLGTDDDVSAR